MPVSLLSTKFSIPPARGKRRAPPPDREDGGGCRTLPLLHVAFRPGRLGQDHPAKPVRGPAAAASDVSAFAELSLGATTGRLFVALVVGGAVLSLQDGAVLEVQQSMSSAAHTIHQAAPLLALLATALTIYLLAGVRS